MLLFLIILSVVLFSISHTSWRSKIRCGISPTQLYALVWGTIWFIHWADFMYYRPISERALIYSAIPLIAIFIAEFLALSASGRIVPKEWVFRRDALRRWTLFCGMVTLFAGMVVFVSSWISFGNVFRHAIELKLSRTGIGLNMYSGTPFALPAKYSSIILGASYPAIILGALQLRLVNRKAWLGIVMPMAGTLLYDMGWGSRSHIYDVVVLLITVYFLVPLPGSATPWKHIRKRLKRKINLSGKLLIVVLLAGCIFAANVIGEKTRGVNTLSAGDLVLPFSILQLIDYHVAVLIGFDDTIDDTTERTWGRVSFAGFEQWLRLFRIIPRSIPLPKQLADWEDQYVRYQPDYLWWRSGNVFTWLRSLYSDFGVLGLFLFPFFVGWFATRSAISAVAEPRGLRAVTFVCIWYLVLVRSQMIVMFRNEYFVFGFLLLYYAGSRIVRPVRTEKTLPIAEEGKAHGEA